MKYNFGNCPLEIRRLDPRAECDGKCRRFRSTIRILPVWKSQGGGKTWDWSGLWIGQRAFCTTWRSVKTINEIAVSSPAITRVIHSALNAALGIVWRWIYFRGNKSRGRTQTLWTAKDKEIHAVVSFWRVRELDAHGNRTISYNTKCRFFPSVGSTTVITVSKRTSVLDTVDSHTGQINRYFFSRVRRKSRRCDDRSSPRGVFF